MKLPEEVKEVKGCPLTWLEDSFEDVESVTQHFQQLLNKSGGAGGQQEEDHEGMEEVDHEEEDEEMEVCHPLFPNYPRSFSRQVNKVVMMTFLGDYEGAVRQLVKLREALDGLSGEDNQKILKRVVEYLVETCDWSISRMQPAGSSSDKGSPVVELRDKLKVLESDAKARAMLLYFRGSVRNLIPGQREEYFKILLEVIALDPDNHVWYVHAYKAFRHERRVFERGDQPMRAPTQHEMALCEKAYLLESNILTAFNLAMMLKDCLWMTVYQRCFRFSTKVIEPCPLDHSETLRRCLKSFDEVIRLAEENDLDDWVLRSVVQKAEVLCHHGADEATRAEGLSMLLKLIEEHPDNAYYHQKLGRVFQYGVQDDRGHKFLKDVAAAHEHLKKALDLHQRNYYSCLGDYMKLFKVLPSPIPAKEALDYLTASLTRSDLIREKVLKSRLRMFRGGLLWIHNPEDKALGKNKREACGEWLSVLEEYPELQEMLFKFIWKPPFTVHGRGRPTHAEICTEELKNVLEKIKEEEEDVSAKTLEAVEVILEEIERKPQLSRLMATVKIFQDNENYVTDPKSAHNLVPWKTKKNRNNGGDPPEEEKKYVPPQYRGGGRKPRADSLADKDDNWRA